MTTGIPPDVNPQMLQNHIQTWHTFTHFIKYGVFGSLIVMLVALYFIV